jgi:nondiscriminating aspartyl-tRNA synthetase
MERTLIKDTVSKIGQVVTLKGWVKTKRDHSKIVFIDLRDRSGLVQVVFWGDIAGMAKGLGTEDAIEIEGLVKERSAQNLNPDLDTGTIEIEASKLKVLATSAEMPIDMGKETLDLDIPTLLDYRSLSFRHPKVQAIFKVQAVIIDAFRKALIAKDFLEFQAPSIINAIPEGGAEVFKVKYFDSEAYLSQSPQLYKSLLTTAFERVFSVNQIFRAEPSSTTRHLTEATSLDAEFNFIDSWEEVQEMEEYVVRSILQEVGERCQKELALFNATIPTMSDKFPILKLRDAQEIIFQRTGRDCRNEKDFAPEDEREICAWAKEEKGSDLIFISHFPTKKKPFYVYPDPADPEYAYSVDLLCRGVEWSSGGQRLNDYQNILKNVKEWGLKEEDVALYLQAFKFGSPQLGGFALGAERVTMYILGLKNIREASMFPRDMERIDVRLSDSSLRGTK